MSAQASLFEQDDAFLPVRASDPQTSRVAAKSVNMRERKREVIESMTRLGGSVTAGQIQADMARHGVLRERGTVASRLSQLEHDGRVRKVGVRQIARSLGTGRPETTWRLV